MRRVSNNITLPLKLFIPTFWLVFFTSFLVAIYLVDADSMPLLANPIFRIVYTAGYIIFGLFLYFTVWRLVRIDMGEDKWFASSYFNTYSYNYVDIEKMEEQNYGLFRTMTIHLKSPGKLGKKLIFIPSRKNLEFFIDNHPEKFSHL